MDKQIVLTHNFKHNLTNFISPVDGRMFHKDFDCIFKQSTVVFDTGFNTFDGEEGPTCGRFVSTFLLKS